jgi:hypothetical protein
LLLSVLTVGAIAAQDDEESADNADSQIVNVEIILDASGSMAEEIEPGVTRIDAAKTVLRSIIGKLPQSDNVNIGVRVYGHKGANNETGRAECSLRSSTTTSPSVGRR